MRTFHPFHVKDVDVFRETLLRLSATTEHFCYLDSNNYPNYPYSTFGSLFAIGATAVLTTSSKCLEQLNEFQSVHNEWLFGFLNYDLKNEIEEGLQSGNHDELNDPLIHFFVPEYLVRITDEAVGIGIQDNGTATIESFKKLIDSPAVEKKTLHITAIRHRILKEDYIKSVELLKKHIQRGDIYETNFCQEFYAKGKIDPLEIFRHLNVISKAPFSSFFKNKNHYLMCASPERFLKRHQNKLIAQPVKGTRKRADDIHKDKLMQAELLNDEKERSENIMIVDLVRNDLSKVAVKNTVKVEELFGIYTFEQVHQMISTITCNIEPTVSFTEIIRNTFPMGSMTGAPKVAAMHLIERYEQSKRGLYSGAVGYITPKGNFDFNVVIRSILYNEDQQYISLQAGSAITADCNAEVEYEECLLKAKAMIQALSGQYKNEDSSIVKSPDV